MSVPRKPSDKPRDKPTGPADRDRHGLRNGLPGLRDMMDRLLSDDGCPWDRRQTLDTLRPYLLEEAHEVLEAMDDPAAHRGELGDLLFQIVFQAALREREGAFDLDDVIASIRDKMIRRHPHVFAPTGGKRTASDAEEVSRQWEAIKQQERHAAREAALAAGEAESHEPVDDPFAGIPKALPALVRAWRLQDKAAALGFDWPEVQGALDKFEEEWAELQQARVQEDPAAMREELGDLLFVLCRIASKLQLDPEDALRRANAKFERRFAHVLRRCREGGLDPTEAGLSRLDGWWNEAKAGEK